MWIVNLALRRPYTFIVLAIFILIAGVLSIVSTPKDIFPSINIPVISVIFNFPGLSPKDMEQHLTTVYERVLTTTVDNIEHIESESLFGIAVVKIYLQPNASVPRGIAQVTSVSQAILRQLPTGATPPLVLSYSATNVPVLRVGLSGLSEQQLNDLGLNFVRPQFITVPGVSVPYPYGGKQKFVEVDLNYKSLQGYGLTPNDVVNTITAQNLTLPAGTEKIGRFEYLVGLNSSPDTIEKLNAIPIKSLANGTTIYIRDVANIVNGSIPQTNIVRFNGQRATMLDIQKTGSASTLDIVQGIKNIIPDLKQTLPPTLNVSMLSDQSIFVTGAIDGVVREAVIAACLTAIMILLFLGDWKSTLIIAISIPLAILSSIAALSAIGETLNIMTLGGLALAVGILVDDATVTIENINWHLEQGKQVEESILDGAAQIVTPAFVSLLCICIAFVPMFFLDGVARYLFVPMAEAVIAAMTCSFILSRTLVPTMANYLLHRHAAHTDTHGRDGPRPRSRNPLVWMQRGFEAAFERFREAHRGLLALALAHRAVFIAGLLAVVLGSFALVPFLGRDFFPSVAARQVPLHT